MKIKTLCILFTMSFSAMAMATENTGTKNTVRENTQGYPYSQLSGSADSIKINYSESEGVVDCSVTMTKQDVVLKSSNLKTLKNRFAVAPLSACLPKSEARKWLAKIR